MICPSAGLLKVTAWIFWTFVFEVIGLIDAMIRFWGQKVGGQGHNRQWSKKLVWLGFRFKVKRSRSQPLEAWPSMAAHRVPSSLVAYHFAFSLLSFGHCLVWQVALLVGHWTCDSQVAGSSSGWAPSCFGLGQATYTCVPLSPSSIIWYWSKSGYALWLGR